MILTSGGSRKVTPAMAPIKFPLQRSYKRETLINILNGPPPLAEYLYPSHNPKTVL